MKRVAILGAGMDGLRLWDALMHCGSVEVVAFVDADARLHGRSRAGLPIHPPAWLDSFTGDVIAGSGGTFRYLPRRQHDSGWAADRGREPSDPADRAAFLPTHLDDRALRRAALDRYPDPLAARLAAHSSAGHTRIGVFGTGAAAAKVWEAVSELDDLEPVWFADNDVRQQGREFLWLPVIAPSMIPSHHTEYVVVGSMSREPIRRQLLALGVAADRIVTPDVNAAIDDIRRQLDRLASKTTAREVLV